MPIVTENCIGGNWVCRGVGRPRNLVTVQIAGSNPVRPALPIGELTLY